MEEAGEMSGWVEDDPGNGIVGQGQPKVVDKERYDLLIELFTAALLGMEPQGLRVMEHQLVAARRAMEQGVRLEAVRKDSIPDRMGTREPVYVLRLVKRNAI